MVTSSSSSWTCFYEMEAQCILLAREINGIHFCFKKHTLDLRTSSSSAQVMIEPIKDSALGWFSTSQLRTHFSDAGLFAQCVHAC